VVNLDYVKMFARRAHQGQVRKYTGEDYVEHVLAVGQMYQSWCAEMNRDALYAAVLHDTVEDTPVTHELIQQQFGDQVAQYVWYLTKPENFVGNRAARKALDRARLALAPEVVRFVKVIDIMHNAKSIKEHDPKFWETFRVEAIQLFDAMKAESVWKSQAGHWAQREYSKFIAELIDGL
jgi:(p)ppGpp synthase/HD superfamily hydrolase